MESKASCFFLLKQYGVFRRVEAEEDLKNLSRAFFGVDDAPEFAGFRADWLWRRIVESFDKEMAHPNMAVRCLAMEGTERLIKEYSDLTGRIVVAATANLDYFILKNRCGAGYIKEVGLKPEEVVLLYRGEKRLAAADAWMYPRPAIRVTHLYEAVGPLRQRIMQKLKIAK